MHYIFKMRRIPVLLSRYVVVVIILVLSSIEKVNAFIVSQSKVSTTKTNRLISQQQATSSNIDIQEKNKVLVLGGTGFVGTHVIDILKQKDIPYIATSTNGRDDTIKFNTTDDNACKQLLDIYLTNDVETIVSTIGCILTDNDDYIVNAASGQTSTIFKDVSSKPKFIFIGNTPRVRNVCNIIPSLNEYARGKEESELLLEQTFGQNLCMIKPTFIYGGTKFGLNPPRIPSFLGEIVEAVLGLYPIQWIAEVLPDILGVVLEAPVNVKAVSNAIVNEAIGLCDNQVFDTKEDIIMAASKRPSTFDNKLSAPEMGARRKELKTILSTKASEYTNEQNFAMLEELEQLKPTSMHPTEDSLLDGRWDFCFEVEPDVGTGFIKEMFEGDGPDWAKKILSFEGVHMEIGNKQSTIQLVVSVKVFEKDITVILHTSLTTAQQYNDEGTMFREKFEGIEVNGFRLPYPNVWKKSRYLEFSYLDDQFAIARGSGGEPHFLLRGS